VKFQTGPSIFMNIGEEFSLRALEQQMCGVQEKGYIQTNNMKTL
jgi:hypothetical protein